MKPFNSNLPTYLFDQTFEGENTHLLSEEETQLFWNKISLSGRWFSNDEKKLKEAIERIIETPTGREQARQIINSPIENFQITVSRKYDKTLKQLGCAGAYFIDNQVIYIHSDMLDQDRIQTGIIILHELLHARQPNTNSEKPKIYMDAETQALTYQLAYESRPYMVNPDESEFYSSAYNKSFEQNLEKWRQIAQGKIKRPSWAPPFRPSNSYSYCLNNYAHQMASLETRTQFINDWISSSQDLKTGDKDMPIYDYNLLYRSRLYDEQDALLNQTIKRDWNTAIEDIRALKEQYPSLDTNEIIQSLEELENEYNSYNENSLHQPNQSFITDRSTQHPLFMHNENFLQEHCDIIKQYMDANPLTKATGIPSENIIELTTHQQGDLNQKISILVFYAKDTVNHGLTKKSKDILQQTANYILNNPDLSRSEKLKYTSQVLASSQALFPEDKESRRAIVSNMNRTLGTKIPLVQENTQGLLQRLQSSQETPFNDQNNQIQMPLNNSKDIA